MGKEKCRVLFRWGFVFSYIFFAAYLINSYTHFFIAKKHHSIVLILLMFSIEYVLLYLICVGSIRKRRTNLKIRLLIYILLPVVVFYIEEIMWNKQIFKMDFFMALCNVLIIMIIMIIVLLVTGKPSFTYIFLLLCGGILGATNYFVKLFRGSPPSISDILAIKTALSVAGNYNYTINDEVVYSFLLMLACIIICLVYAPNKLIIKRRNVRLLYAGILTILLIFFDFTSTFDGSWGGISWEKQQAFVDYGSPLILYKGIRGLKAKKPQNYDRHNIESILNSYTNSESVNSNYVKPNIIVIMNEAFADLDVLGTKVSSQDYLENWNNNTNYVMRGYVYTPVFGGITCNTEFEFLTGFSMKSIDKVPYMNLDLKNKSSMITALSTEGYKNVAFHPYEKANWNRSVVYPSLGFTDFIGDESIVTYKSINNMWISDQTDYEFIENYIDKHRSDYPIFLFNVTMQNHAGYNVQLDPSIQHIELYEDYSDYKDLENYLTLIKESDNAFQELIDYYSEFDYPTIICMFGDHQPALDERVIDEITADSYLGDIEKKEIRYKTPYIIWANYSIPGISTSIEDMSTNYLGARLLNIVGIRTSFTDYLLGLQEEIPVINPYGYKTKEGKWHDNSEDNEKLQEYEMVQYYELYESH